jgi:hypothetical protein
MQAQQQLAEHMTRQQLGTRYLRLDSEQSREHTLQLAMDVASEAARRTLLALADGAWQETGADPALAAFLAHGPAAPEFATRQP